MDFQKQVDLSIKKQLRETSKPAYYTWMGPSVFLGGYVSTFFQKNVDTPKRNVDTYPPVFILRFLAYPLF